MHRLLVEPALAGVAPLRLHQTDPRLRSAELDRHRVQAAVVSAVEDTSSGGSRADMVLILHGERCKTAAEERLSTALCGGRFPQVRQVQQAGVSLVDGVADILDVQLAHGMPLSRNSFKEIGYRAKIGLAVLLCGRGRGS